LGVKIGLILQAFCFGLFYYFRFFRFGLSLFWAFLVLGFSRFGLSSFWAYFHFGLFSFWAYFHFGLFSFRAFFAWAQFGQSLFDQLRPSRMENVSVFSRSADCIDNDIERPNTTIYFVRSPYNKSKSFHLNV